MKIYLVYELNDHYPYSAIEESIHAFSTYDKMFAYLSEYYDKNFPDDAERVEAYTYWSNTPNWETYKKVCIEQNDHEYIQWKEVELE